MFVKGNKYRRSKKNQAGVLTVESGDTLTVASGATLALAAGSTLTNAGKVVDSTEVVATTNVIEAAESGKTFFLNDVDGFTSTLPAPAAGLNYKFIVSLAPTEAGYVIDTGAANIIYGIIDTVPADDAGIAVAAQQKLTFVVDVALIGDWVELTSDGTNWYVRGGVNVVEALTVAQS